MPVAIFDGWAACPRSPLACHVGSPTPTLEATQSWPHHSDSPCKRVQLTTLAQPQQHPQVHPPARNQRHVAGRRRRHGLHRRLRVPELRPGGRHQRAARRRRRGAHGAARRALDGAAQLRGAGSAQARAAHSCWPGRAGRFVHPFCRRPPGACTIALWRIKQPALCVPAPSKTRRRAATDAAAQALRKALGWWLIGVAPLVPAKALFFASSDPPSPGARGEDGAVAPAAASPPPAPLPGAAALQQAASPAAAVGGSEGSGGSGTGSGMPVLRPLRPTDAIIAATGVLAGA